MKREELNQRLAEMLELEEKDTPRAVSIWAEANGYDRKTVIRVLPRWLEREDGHPGGLTGEMLIKLSLQLQAPVSPALTTFISSILAQDEGKEQV